MLPASPSLVPAVAVLAGCRVASWAAFLVLAQQDWSGRRAGGAVRPGGVGPLLRFAGWMTVSNVVGPLMVSLDRLLIGARSGMEAVAFYATPFEAITKLWILPGVVVRVLFPAFAASHVSDRTRTAQLFDRAVRATLLAVLPVTLAVVMLAEDGLYLWLGAEFARRSTRVLQFLAVGVFVNCLGQVAFALVQAVGRPDLTARFHLAELPLYLAGAWVLISWYGINGAALAWTLRVFADAVVLFIAVGRLLPKGAGSADPARHLLWAALPALAMALPPCGLAPRGALLLLALAAVATAAWRWVLAVDERALVACRLRGSFASRAC
jgi:O-antigen/teichoic acid export membrane protein